jgi:hypothetical protein
MRFVYCLWLLAHAAWANGPLPLPRLSSPIKLDGMIDEPAWQEIEPLPLVMYQPTYKGAMAERTEIRVAYDDDAIYMSGKLFHRNVKDMRGNSFYRDRWSGDDTFAIILDTFNDNENAVWFYTNPLGTRFDIAIANDLAVRPRDQNHNWNADWQVATARMDSGWCAEFRIPFSSLSFQDDAGRVTMGLTVYRWLSVGEERYVYPNISPKLERGFSKPSQAQDVVLEGVYRKKPVYLTPYALGGVDQLTRLDQSQTAYRLAAERTAEIGLDAKYNLSRNLTLDATINTDFAQVEADDQQINLTRFSLFYPEKRQFFQERAGMFEFGFDNSNRLFHSRRIGLDDDGQPLRIYGGARLVGRINKWDVGFLNMQTQSSASLPSENFGVLRLRRQVINRHSNAGGIITSRLGAGGRYDLAYGLDGVVRVFAQDYLTLKWAQTSGNETAPRNWLNASRFFFDWQRRKIEGFSYNLTYSRAGADFDPGLGFESRRDFSYVWNSLDYQWFKGASSKFRRVWIGNWANVYTRNADGSVESAWLHPFLWLELKGGVAGAISTEHSYEEVRQSFFLSKKDGVEIPAGRYWFHNAWLIFDPSDGWYFRPLISLRAGSFYDGTKITFNTETGWNLSKHFELAGNYEVNFIRFPERDQKLTSHLGRLRIQSALNARVSLNTFLQYNSAAEALSINARFRYHFREGDDLWVVYNEGLNLERNPMTSESPRLSLTNSRAVLMKFTKTLTLD